MSAPELRTRHLEIELEVDFPARRVRGQVTHQLERSALAGERLLLDGQKLEIHGVEGRADGGEFTPRDLHVGREHEIWGNRLEIPLQEGDSQLRIRYRSSESASGLQWLAPEQTAGGNHPFLFSQGQTIHTRSWLPCLDQPSLRTTFRARISCPPELRAVMAAPRRRQLSPGHFEFEMPLPIPSYLIALAVGRIEEAALGPRTAVFAEPERIDAARWEFAHTEKMLESCEALFGPYRWERYDLLVMPPSAPLGGMENPTLTFVTPTVLAGDRSLVSIVAHELAHSWSGNLVTNAGWGDFWLNEGFTVYLERRIVEELYGIERARIEACIGRDRLGTALAALANSPERTRLAQREPERHPDHSITEIPYEKGYLFLCRLEELHGRQRFDAFLRSWFEAHAFESVDSATFERYLARELPSPEGFDAAEWLHEDGLPDDAPETTSQRLHELRDAAASTARGELPDAAERASWSPHEWILFLRELDPRTAASTLDRLAAENGLDESRNPEIQSLWLSASLRAGRKKAFDDARRFLMEVGRHKLIAPVYAALRERKDKLAREIYLQARPRYHAMVHLWLDGKMGVSGSK